MQAELPPGTRQTIQQQGGLSSDTRAMMLFEANKKTALVAYILWFFLGLFGGHNFLSQTHRRRRRPTHLDAYNCGDVDHGRLGACRCILDPRLGEKSEQPAGCATRGLGRHQPAQRGNMREHFRSRARAPVPATRSADSDNFEDRRCNVPAMASAG